MSESRITRRNVVTGSAVTAVGVPLLAACGGDKATDGAGGSGSGADGGALIATSEVPVGGGVIVADRNLVATQPTEGTFKVFSAVCTHQGCSLTKVVDGTIDCPCHGSRFSIEDGSVSQGPARSPLEEVTFEVTGGEIVPS